MVDVTEKHLVEINDWRIQLKKELKDLTSELENRKKELEILELKSNILTYSSEKLAQNERQNFWKTHGEEVESEFSKAHEEFDEFKKQNYKKQREINIIIGSIEEFFKRNNFEY